MPDNLYARVRDTTVAALREAVPGLPPEIAARVEVTPSRDPAHGDLATNAAMVSAKSARQPPAKLAQAIAEALTNGPDILEATPAGPGFVNIRLRPETLRATLPAILQAGESYGDSTAGRQTPVNIEYVSANPTGPMHIGHCRGAVVGDALANLLRKAGFAVTKEYYINDAGAQVQALAWAAYWRYLQAAGTALTEDEYATQVPGGLQYRGDYLVPVGEALFATHGPTLAGPGATIADPALWLDTVRGTAIAAMLDSIRTDLAALGVVPDIWTSERALVEADAVDKVIGRLQAQGLIYEGILEPPKGKTPEDWEPREQTLFRATQFGDDVDRPLRKVRRLQHLLRQRHRLPRRQDGPRRRPHDRRLGRRPRRLRLPHEGRRQAPSPATARQRLDIVLCQIVHVLRGGQPVRMSKRAGTYVTLSDLLEWVGRDAVRFTMLTRKSDAQMEFDLDAVRRPNPREPGLLRPIRPRPLPLRPPRRRRDRATTPPPPSPRRQSRSTASRPTPKWLSSAASPPGPAPSKAPPWRKNRTGLRFFSMTWPPTLIRYGAAATPTRPSASSRPTAPPKPWRGLPWSRQRQR